MLLSISLFWGSAVTDAQEVPTLLTPESHQGQIALQLPKAENCQPGQRIQLGVFRITADPGRELALHIQGSHGESQTISETALTLTDSIDDQQYTLAELAEGIQLSLAADVVFQIDYHFTGERMTNEWMDHEERHEYVLTYREVTPQQPEEDRRPQLPQTGMVRRQRSRLLGILLILIGSLSWLTKKNLYEKSLI